MLKKIKHLVLGQSLRSDALDHEKFSVIWGLPVLSSDAISSVSYACEEILMVLIPVLGMASYGLLMKVGFAIVFLLFILVFSYRQTINCYPQGGGSYIVASDNLGKVFGLIAAASLAIDYVLTVAVSVCAGTAAFYAYGHRADNYQPAYDWQSAGNEGQQCSVWDSDLSVYYHDFTVNCHRLCKGADIP